MESNLFAPHSESETESIKRFMNDAFKRTDLTYKSINDIPFNVGVLIPKSDVSSVLQTSPLLVHFHGGGLILGEVLEVPMLARWVLELAAQKGAVVVSPSYRLIPEATGSDIFDDIQDFWAWVHRTLPLALSDAFPRLSLNLGHIAVTGESAGGFLSLLSAASFPDAGIKAAMAQHPGMDPAHPAYNVRPAHVSSKDEAFVMDYIRDLSPGAIRLSSPLPEGTDLFMAMTKTGGHREIIGKEKRMRLGDVLKEKRPLPPIWIAQGADDKIVPKTVTDQLVANIKETHSDTPILYTVQPGLHGFDAYDRIETPWVQEGVKFVQKSW